MTGNSTRILAYSSSRLALLIGTFTGLASAAHAGAPLPVGGGVASGTASIATGLDTTTINQTSARAVINWQSFDVSAGKQVNFVQPNVQSATLNRVTGSAASIIAGQITSNGAVYLVNPNGIAITASGTVNTAGGFVASTLDIADADFMAGTLAFKGNGASGNVSNAGQINARQGAYVALLGGSVSNNGFINVPLGKVGLGSGENIALDLNGNGFMQVAVPTRALTGNSALVDNAGSITASGGYVQLQAATVKDAVRNVINISGSINADSATGDGGTIHLIGGADTASMAGTVTVNGTLSARATGASGNGGIIETSGETVNFTGVKVDTSAAHGKAGTWLLDPTDLVIDTTAATAINSALGTSNVTLQTTASGAPSGPSGSTGNTISGFGNINVVAPISWSANTTLTLNAYNNIGINAAITATGSGGAVSLIYGQNGSSSAKYSFGLGAINLQAGNNFSTQQGSNAAINYTVITSLGSASDSSSQSSSASSLQGLDGGANVLSGNYALGVNIDALSTSGWHSGAGFRPIGVTSGLAFTGNFTGLGHTVSSLFINYGGNDTGLFWQFTGGSLRDFGLVGGSVSSNGSYSYTGAVAGLFNAGTALNVFAQGTTVSGYTSVGGLFGGVSGSVVGSYATGSVTARNATAGGLVGYLFGGSITNSYATGDVSVTSAVALSYAGGLIGRINNTSLVGSPGASVTYSYATGNVSGVSYIGGFLGYYNASSNGGTPYTVVSNDWASGNVTSTTAASSNRLGGFVGQVGYTTSGTFTNAFTNDIAMGTVTPKASGQSVGGFAGYVANQNASYAWFANDYYNSTTAGSAVTKGVYFFTYTPTSSGVTALTTAQFTTASNFAGLTFSTSTSTPGWVIVDTDGSFNNAGGAAGATFPMLTAQNTPSLSTPAQLQLIGLNPTGSYQLTGDVSLSGTSITPIGTQARPFSGSFNGGGFTISGLNINTSSNYAGLFGYSSGTLSNLTLSGSVTSTGNFVGGLVGKQNGGSISNVTSTVTVNGAAIVGSLAGGTSNATLSNDSASGTVTGTNAVGGLVGSQIGGSISTSSSSGAVTGSGAYAGGLVGVSWGGIISGSHATADVSGATDVGGLVGYAQGSGSIIAASYTSGGTISGLISTGGLVGFSEGSIATSTSSDSVNGVSFAGGLVGRQADGSISGSTSSGSVTGGNVAGSHFLGGLVGYQDPNANVSYSSSSSNVTSLVSSGVANYVGGLIGIAHGSITGSSASGAVGGTNTDYSGGLVGLQAGAIISTSSATGSVSGVTSVGGLVGYTVSGSIDQAYASGAVSGSGRYAGGLIGFLNSGTLSNVYATGSTSGGALYAGGLIGYQYGGDISQAYATGAVSGGFKMGGLIGYQQAGTLINGVWDTQTTGQASGFGYKLLGATFTATGLTTLQAQDFTSYSVTYPGFDFTTLWNTPNQVGQNGSATAAYPKLKQVP